VDKVIEDRRAGPTYLQGGPGAPRTAVAAFGGLIQNYA